MEIPKFDNQPKENSELPKEDISDAEEESNKREKITLEIEGQTIEGEKYYFEYPERIQKETGGVVGYTRYKLDTKLNLDNDNQYEKRKTKLVQLIEALGISTKEELLKKEGNYVHYLNGVWGRGFSGEKSDKNDISKERFFLQRPFNPYIDNMNERFPIELIEKWSQKDGWLSEGVKGSFFVLDDDNNIKKDIFLSSRFSNFLSYSEDLLINELVETYREKGELGVNEAKNYIANTLNTSNLLLGTTNSHDKQPGLSTTNSFNEYPIGGTFNSFSLEKAFCVFNNNNIAFEKRNEKLLLLLEEIFSKNTDIIKQMKGDRFPGHWMKEASQIEIPKVKALIESKAYNDISHRQDGSQRSHMHIPIFFSRKYPELELRWCHADFALIPSENGMNFIKFHSVES